MATLYTDEQLQEFYNNTNKCKVSGKIISIEKKLNNTQCEFNDIKLLINSGEKTYYINGTEYIENGCIIETSFPIFGEDGTEYYPSKGDNIDVVLNIDKDYGILKYGKEFLSNDIHYCTGNILKTISNNDESISQEIKPMDAPVKIEETPTIQTSTPVKTPPKVIQEKPITKQTFTGEIVSNSNSGIIIPLVSVSETNTGGQIGSGSLIASGNVVKPEDIQNISNSGIETEYQTGVTQETTPVISKKMDASTQMYGIIAVIVILMIAFAYYLKNYTK